MTVRTRALFAAAVALGWGGVLPAQEPPRLDGAALRPSASFEQRVADSIADHLRQSGQLRHYNIDVTFQDGTAELSGVVADQAQREEALRIAQGVPAVSRLRDRLVLAADRPVRQVQASAPAQPEVPMPRKADGNGARLPEPAPVFQAPIPSPYDLNPPKMPPYAWPTYAPYDNYSRVAYPQDYPYNAWPFIGPNYPFPRVPLNWRSVKLTWEDGAWWYSHHATSHDWWRLRYW